MRSIAFVLLRPETHLAVVNRFDKAVTSARDILNIAAAIMTIAEDLAQSA